MSGSQPGLLSRIVLPKQAYPLNSGPESNEDLLNLFAEAEPGEARASPILRPTPGTVLYKDFGTGPVTAMSEQHGTLYFISGDQAYKVTSDNVSNNLGTVLAGNNATIAIGANEVVFCTPPKAYYAANDSGLLYEITGDAFPGASSVTYLDGYFIFTQPGTGQFFISKLTSGHEFDPLDYATQEAMPDVVKRGINHLGAYWLFGADAIEVWADVGAVDFPFRRQPGGVIYGGTTSPDTICKLDNSLCWLARDNIVYQSAGFQAQRISNFALEQFMLSYGDTQDAYACSYTQEGHKFYVLTFPSAPDGGRTWVYDAATQLWHRRNTPGLARWRARCAAQFGQSPIIGDDTTGRIYFLVETVETDGLAEDVIFRTAVFPPITASQRRAYMHRFELEMEVGSALTPHQITVDWSDDGGASYGPQRILQVEPSRMSRPYAARLGSFRQRTMRLTIAGYATIYAADAILEAAAS